MRDAWPDPAKATPGCLCGPPLLCGLRQQVVYTRVDAGCRMQDAVSASVSMSADVQMSTVVQRSTGTAAVSLAVHG
jgi:hypothetical protein